MNIQKDGQKKFEEQKQILDKKRQSVNNVPSIGAVRATLTGVLELVQTSDSDPSFRPGRVSVSSITSKGTNKNIEKKDMFTTNPWVFVLAAASGAIVLRSVISKN